MRQFGVEDSDIQRLQLELLKEQDVATLLLKQKKRDAPVHIDWGKMALPEGAMPVKDYAGGSPDFVNAVEYLYERGFDITDNRLWYSDTKTPRMYKRFIILLYKGIPRLHCKMDRQSQEVPNTYNPNSKRTLYMV